MKKLRFVVSLFERPVFSQHVESLEFLDDVLSPREQHPDLLLVRHVLLLQERVLTLPPEVVVPARVFLAEMKQLRRKWDENVVERFFGRLMSFYGATRYPCFGLLVTVPLVSKPDWAALFTLGGGVCVTCSLSTPLPRWSSCEENQMRTYLESSDPITVRLYIILLPPANKVAER